MIAAEVCTLVGLTLASAFCSSSEVAFFSLPLQRLKSYKTDPDPRKKKCALLMSQATGLLVTVFMLNTIVNILLQNAASDLFGEFGGGWLLKVGIPLVVILIFGELVPKYFGLMYNEALAQMSVHILSLLHLLVRPFRLAITWISQHFSRLFFFFLKAEAPLTNQELQHILESSEGKGLLTRQERETVLGVLALEHKQVHELMIPKNKMPLYDIQEPLSKLFYLFSESGCNEIAVIQNPQEKILGTLRAADLFIKRAQIASQHDLKPLLKEPFFVPETTSAKSLLHQFAHTENTTALVIDEHGQTTGTISEFDLIKQIAKLKSAANTSYKRVSKDAIIAPGSLSIDEVNALFNTHLTSDYHLATIGGWLTEKLETIPKSQTTYQQQGLFFRILAADATKVIKIYIQPVLSKKGAS